MKLDQVDIKILQVLETNSDISLSEIGKKVGIFSASAISRRIENMKKEGIIERYGVELNLEKLGINFVTITFVKARYGPGYIQKIADHLLKIKNVISVYFLLGDIDFVLITKSRSKEDYEAILNKLTEIVEIERTDSRTVLKVLKENDYSSLSELIVSNLKSH